MTDHSSNGDVRVWDILVRIFHWSLVAAFTIAYASAEVFDAVHEWSGYIVMALVAFRVVWGLIGPRHARFADFVYRPAHILAYAKAMLAFRAPRYLGHNPLGGAMVLALLAALAALTGTGYLMTTTAFWGVAWVEELHEILSSLMLVLIAVHVAGVLFSSLEHHENLVRAMWTGRKRDRS